jgi:uncharacterized protein YjbJ (UPF0337 family)
MRTPGAPVKGVHPENHRGKPIGPEIGWGWIRGLRVPGERPKGCGDYHKEPDMSTKKAAKNSAEKTKGKVKAAVGKLTGNKSLEAKGKRDEAKGSVKQAGEKIKDAAKDAAKK